MREHELAEFEIEHEGLRLKVRKDSNGSHSVTLPAGAGRPPLAAAGSRRRSGRSGGRGRLALGGHRPPTRRMRKSSWPS